MSGYEYKVVVAPRKPGKARGVRGFDDKYAHTLAELMNEQASEGYQYFRAESLPVDEKSGMMGKVTEKYLTLLVFRRAVAGAAEQEVPTFLRAQEPETVVESAPARREPTFGGIPTSSEPTGNDPMRLQKPLSDDEFAENIRELIEQDPDKST